MSESKIAIAALIAGATLAGAAHACKDTASAQAAEQAATPATQAAPAAQPTQATAAKAVVVPQAQVKAVAELKRRQEQKQKT